MTYKLLNIWNEVISEIGDMSVKPFPFSISEKGDNFVEYYFHVPHEKGHELEYNVSCIILEGFPDEENVKWDDEVDKVYIGVEFSVSNNDYNARYKSQNNYSQLFKIMSTVMQAAKKGYKHLYQHLDKDMMEKIKGFAFQGSDDKSRPSEPGLGTTQREKLYTVFMKKAYPAAKVYKGKLDGQEYVLVDLPNPHRVK